MKILMILFLTLTTNSFANDSGVYYLPVEKMQEVSPDDTWTRFEISFEGQKADLLRRSLPNALSIESTIEKHVNTLVLIDDKSASALEITCRNADYIGQSSTTLQPLKTTKCAVRLVKSAASIKDSIRLPFGDTQELKTPMCENWRTYSN